MGHPVGDFYVGYNLYHNSEQFPIPPQFVHFPDLRYN